MMIGYAKANSHTQLYTCHKLLEYNLGLPMNLDNPGGFVQPVSFTYDLPDTKLSSVIAAIEKKAAYKIESAVSYYHELTKEQSESAMSLAYWVQYVNKFDSGHMLPLYVG